MKNFKAKLSNWIRTRTKIDQLNLFLLFLSLLFLILYQFINANIFLIFETFFFLLFIFRFFSYHYGICSNQNLLFKKIVRKIKQPFILTYHKIRDRKTLIYKKCPSCKKTLRLKRIVGAHTVRCPICKNSFEIKVK